MFETLPGRRAELAVEEAAYGKWLDQTSTREEARQDRIHGAAGVMPTPLWIALFFISAIVLAYIFGFADSSERAWVQALFMGSVVAVIVTMLLLLRLPRRPVPRRHRRPPADGDGTHRAAHRPAARACIGGDVTIPCDDDGVPA